VHHGDFDFGRSGQMEVLVCGGLPVELFSPIPVKVDSIRQDIDPRSGTESPIGRALMIGNR